MEIGCGEFLEEFGFADLADLLLVLFYYLQLLLLALIKPSFILLLIPPHRLLNLPQLPNIFPTHLLHLPQDPSLLLLLLAQFLLKSPNLGLQPLNNLLIFRSDTFKGAASFFVLEFHALGQIGLGFTGF